MEEQLNLLNIRQQPEPKLAELRSAVIRQYIKEAMQGYAERQAEREHQRKLQRMKERPRLKLKWNKQAHLFESAEPKPMKRFQLEITVEGHGYIEFDAVDEESARKKCRELAPEIVFPYSNAQGLDTSLFDQFADLRINEVNEAEPE